MSILSQDQINQIFDEIKEDKRVVGILITGSYVYGTPNENSDIDIRCVTGDGSNWGELERIRFGTRVEVFFNPADVVRKYMHTSKEEGHGDCVHFWAYGQVVYDPTGIVQTLQDEARELWKVGPEPGKYWEW